jgi:hypothetical protein
VVAGEVPAWSKVNDKWVAKSSLEAAAIETSSQTDDDDSELTMGATEAPKVAPTETVAPVVTEQAAPQVTPQAPIVPVVEVTAPTPPVEDEDDDLPF